MSVTELQATCIGPIEGNIRDYVSPDIMDDTNIQYEKRLSLFATEPNSVTKTVPLSTQLYSPLQQFNSVVPSNVALSITLRKSDDNRILDSKNNHDPNAVRFQMSIVGIEMFLKRTVLNPELYRKYMSRLLHQKATYNFARFEFTS